MDLKAALRDDDPVMFFQHKKLFAKEGPVPRGDRYFWVHDWTDDYEEASIDGVIRSLNAPPLSSTQSMDSWDPQFPSRPS